MGPNNSAPRIKVLLTIAGLAPEFGGPSRSVPALAEALAREKVDVDLVACESLPGHRAPTLPNSDLVKTCLVPARSRLERWRPRRNDFFCALSEIGRETDSVIHDNGLWLPTNHAVAAAAKHLKRPLIVSPRGMLTEWARAHHGWKKKIAWLFFQRRDLFGASALHATSEQELEDFRRVGFRGPVAIVPNGIDLKTEDGRSKMEDGSRSARTALFVGRIHPVKGLMNLIEAWSDVRPTGWRMIIAGTDEAGHRAELEAAIVARGLANAFEFVGPIEGERKTALYNKADIFILPSHSENFGMSIAEALAHGVPVITTRGTPWKDLTEHRCGWWEEIGAEPLTRALREAIALSDDERWAMGERGRELVAEKYSWSRVAKEMKSVYEWLLGRRDPPSCVVLHNV